MHKKLEAMESNFFYRVTNTLEESALGLATSLPHSIARTAKRLRTHVIPTIAAAIFGIAMLGASTLPASAASTTVATTAHSSARTAPAIWVYYSNYPTKLACGYVGINKVISGGALTYKCVEITVGAYFVWNLYLFE
jgi:hypothetical protein